MISELSRSYREPVIPKEPNAKSIFRCFRAEGEAALTVIATKAVVLSSIIRVAFAAIE